MEEKKACRDTCENVNNYFKQIFSEHMKLKLTPVFI